jgi:hypothetical protein
MRIFFCERCNKRLTDDDVAKGRAVDRKFNGVFCKGCVGSVPTLETWSLPGHQKQSPQAPHAPHAAQPASRRTTPHGGQVATATPPPGNQVPHSTHTAATAPRRSVYGRSTSVARAQGGHSPSGRSGDREHSEEGGYIKASQSQRKVGQPLSVKMCADIAVVVLFIGAIILFAGNSKGPGAAVKKAPAATTEIEPKKVDQNNLERNADIAYEKLVQDWARLSDNAKLDRGESFLRDFEDTSKATKVRLMVNDLKKSR